MKTADAHTTGRDRRDGAGAYHTFDAVAGAGSACGMCLMPIKPTECPSAKALETMDNCENVPEGELERSVTIATRCRTNNYS